MAAKYTLTFFNLCGMGENIRYLFTVAGVPFIDKRVSFAEWPQLKASSPFGHLPFLEFEGHKVSQTIPICRFLAGRFGLMPDDEILRLKADVLAECLVDLRQPEIDMYAAYKTGDKARLEEITKNYEDVKFPQLVAKIEDFIPETEFFAGNKMTWIDIFLAHMTEFLVKAGGTFGYNVSIAGYPKISAIQQKVFSLPQVAEYRKNRPVGEFDF